MELSLDLSLVYVPKTITELLREVSRIKNSSLKLSKLDDYMKRLDAEMRKIDAFKRELPLCMLLIKDAIERLEEEVTKYKGLSDGSEMGDFTPLKRKACEKDGGANLGNDGSESDKKNWLSSVQLWSNNTTTTTTTTNNNNISDHKQQDTISQLKLRTEEDDLSVSENSIHLGEYGNRGGAFVPYKGDSCGFVRTEVKESQEVTQFPGLSLTRPINDLGSCNPSLKSNGSGRIGSGSSIFIEQMKLQTRSQQQQQQQQQTCRKQRRCWSPELHRRFVDALQQLGGSQVATPKQIRELMQVDGLTNDEVKSHLQKYRLHIRKLPASAAAPTDDLWTTKDHSRDNSKQKISESGSPQGPLLARGSAKGMSTSSGTSMETEEDEKSDGHSWKGESYNPGEVDV